MVENKFGNVIQNILKAYVTSNPNSAPLFYQMEDMKRRQEEDERARQWQDWERNVQKEQYEQSQADRQRNTFQVTPDMQDKYGDTTFGFKFKPTDQTVFEQSEETTTPELRSLAKLSGIEIPENYTKSFETTKPVYGSVMTDDIKMAESERQGDLIAQLKAKQAAEKAAEDERRWNEEMKVKWANANKTSGTKKEEPSGQQREFMNSLSSLAGYYRSQNDYLADLNRNRDKIIQKLGSIEAYNALIEDATANASNIWRTQTVTDPKTKDVKYINYPGPQWKKGEGSPMATMFGGSPRILVAKNNQSNLPQGQNMSQFLSNAGDESKQPNSQNANPQSNTVANVPGYVKMAIQQYGSVDKAYEAGKKKGLSDSDPLMKALLEAKKKRKPQDLLASNR